IDPRTAFYQQCQPAENALSDKTTDIMDGVTLHEIGRSTFVAQPAFLRSVFGTESDDELMHRFLRAYAQLDQTGLIYSVTSLWNAPPDHRVAEPLYTLYIHDAHAA